MLNSYGRRREDQCAANPSQMPSSFPENRQRTPVLILSAGSLLGQNILDALEPRRGQVRVIGAEGEIDLADRILLLRSRPPFRACSIDALAERAPSGDLEAWAARSVHGRPLQFEF